MLAGSFALLFYIHFDMPKYQNEYTKVTQITQQAKQPTINSKISLRKKIKNKEKEIIKKERKNKLINTRNFVLRNNDAYCVI